MTSHHYDGSLTVEASQALTSPDLCAWRRGPGYQYIRTNLPLNFRMNSVCVHTVIYNILRSKIVRHSCPPGI